MRDKIIKRTVWTAAVLAVLAATVLLVKCVRGGGSWLGIGFDSRIELTPQEIRRIERIGQWEFLSLRTEVVVDTLRKGFFSDDRLVAIYTGTPRLGIDMAHAGSDWVQADGGTVRLRLPAVGLLDTRFVDEARTRVFHESGKWSNEARKEMYARAHRLIRARSLTPARIRQAEDNARRQFTALFRALGFEVQEIVFVKE